MRKERVGIVISDKMPKTRVVRVESVVRHPLYQKTLKKKKKFYAQDDENKSKIGDLVKIQACRPLSHLKRWRIVEVLGGKG